MSRSINFEDGPNGAPQQPLTMEDLINSAEQDWKFKRKDEAFIKVLGGMALMSQGIAQSIKQSEAALAEALKIKARMDAMEPPK